MRIVLGVTAVLLTFSFGCKNKLAGELDVDGKTFELASCRSGQVYGFLGVELVAKDGTKIRIQGTPSGEGSAFLIPKGKATGIELGTCGPFELRQQNSTINDVKNVAGEAKLDCKANGHSIKGAVSFENCH